MAVGAAAVCGAGVCVGAGGRRRGADNGLPAAGSSQGEIADVQRWGDTAAAVLTDQGTQVLCVAEKQGGQWALVVDNPTALLQGEPLPSLLLDTGYRAVLVV